MSIHYLHAKRAMPDLNMADPLLVAFKNTEKFSLKTKSLTIKSISSD